jgi:hypothetical protein
VTPAVTGGGLTVVVVGAGVVGVGAGAGGVVLDGAGVAGLVVPGGLRDGVIGARRVRCGTGVAVTVAWLTADGRTTLCMNDGASDGVPSRSIGLGIFDGYS